MRGIHGQRASSIQGTSSRGERGWALRALTVLLVLSAGLATPAASAGRGGPGLARCDWEPLTTAQTEAKLEAGRRMPARTPMEEVENVGAAPLGVVLELEGVLRTADACAFDRRRGLRFASDQFLFELWPTAAEELADYTPLDERATPDSPYLGITYVRTMSDGRIGAVYLIDGEAASPVEPTFYLFKRVDGEFHIDEIPEVTIMESTWETEMGVVAR